MRHGNFIEFVSRKPIRHLSSSAIGFSMHNPFVRTQADATREVGEIGAGLSVLGVSKARDEAISAPFSTAAN